MAFQAPRSSISNEINQLADWLHEQGHDDDVAKEIAHAAYVAVYDNYITDCPGYRGKLMSVVWSGSPDCFDVFIWEGRKMIWIERDSGE